MRQIGVVESRRKFSQVLNWVEAGDEVVIMRRGVPVAKLSACLSDKKPKKDLSAIAARIRKRRKGITLDGLSIKEMINEGRK